MINLSDEIITIGILIIFSVVMLPTLVPILAITQSNITGVMKANHLKSLTCLPSIISMVFRLPMR